MLEVEVKFVIVPVEDDNTPIVVDGIEVILAVAIVAVVEVKVGAVKLEIVAVVEVKVGAVKLDIVAEVEVIPPVALRLPIKVVGPTTVKPSNPNIAPWEAKFSEATFWKKALAPLIFPVNTT